MSDIMKQELLDRTDLGYKKMVGWNLNVKNK